MMAKQRLVVLAVLAGIALAGGSWCVLRYYRSLPAWLGRVQRPGYALLHAAQTEDGSYFAVFDAGDDWLAFCHSERGEYRVTSTSVSEADGNDALDTKARQFTTLTRTYHFGVGTYGIIDGEVLPIRRGARGPLRIAYWARDENVLLFSAEVPWGGRNENR
jgi:hypothetical protein